MGVEPLLLDNELVVSVDTVGLVDPVATEFGGTLLTVVAGVAFVTG